MIIDDEEFIINTNLQLLQQLGIKTEYHVDSCICGKDAIEQLIDRYSHEFSYKIIFTDYKMPIMDGAKTTEQIRF